MSKRIFICAERFFPRGDAGANRVLYIAKAMQEMSWSVIVISIGSSDTLYLNQNSGKYMYDDIEFKNIRCTWKGKGQKIERLLLNGSRTVELLKTYELEKNDKVLIYSSTAGYVGTVKRYAHDTIGASVAMDVVEWHQPFQFSYGRYDPRYLSYKKCFDKLYASAGNVVVISECLKQYFEQRKCNVLKLPIYVVTKDQFVYHPTTDGILDLIYPGNPYRKDSLEMMMEGIAALSENERKHVRFHLTGVSRALLEKSIPGKKALLNMPCVMIHKWMEYPELIALYESIDFAFIARPNNIVTRANFPSKVPEVMNKGIPVVINDIGDICEYLSDGRDTIIIDSSTPEACTAALRRCLKLSQEDILSMHQAAFETAKNKFDYYLCAKVLDEYFLMLN